MIIECSSCHSKYKYDESKLEGAASKKVRCPKCKSVIEVHRPQTISRAKGVDAFQALERTYSTAPGGAEPSPTPVGSNPAMGDEDEGPRTAQVRRDSLMAEMPARIPSNDNMLKMPEYRRYSLAVIQGYNAGEIFQISKPKMVIGRTDADILVKDLEASRQHARIDVMGDRVILRDLNSTNGTFVNEQKITTISLDNQQEFRIGTTVFMLIITDLD